MTDEEIHAKVWERFPRLEIEWRCMTEARCRDAARESYRQRLKNEFQRSQEILVAGSEADA